MTCIGWSVLIYHLLVEDVYCCGARKSGKVVLVGVVAGVQKSNYSVLYFQNRYRIASLWLLNEWCSLTRDHKTLPGLFHPPSHFPD